VGAAFSGTQHIISDLVERDCSDLWNYKLAELGTLHEEGYRAANHAMRLSVDLQNVPGPFSTKRYAFGGSASNVTLHHICVLVIGHYHLLKYSSLIDYA